MRLRILLSCLFGFASAAAQSIQMELPERIAVSELEVNDLVLNLTPEQLPELIERTSAEDVQAQCILGVAYQRGIIVPHNDAEAMKWLPRAASHGIAWVQHLLGSMYRRGAGVPQDYSEASRWFRAAAEQHYPAAADSLAYMYLNGKGVKKDYALAAKWYAAAAEQGYAPAQNNLGQLYEHGIGVHSDCTIAVQWYRQAVLQGLASAQNNLGAMYEAGLGVPRNYMEALKCIERLRNRVSLSARPTWLSCTVMARVSAETFEKRLTGT
jgi:TPR repeat protein